MWWRTGVRVWKREEEMWWREEKGDKWRRWRRREVIGDVRRRRRRQPDLEPRLPQSLEERERERERERESTAINEANAKLYTIRQTRVGEGKKQENEGKREEGNLLMDWST